jgi:hypothetical protein
MKPPNPNLYIGGRRRINTVNKYPMYNYLSGGGLIVIAINGFD